MTDFIRREFHVEEPDKTTVIRQDQPAKRPAMPGADVLYLIGLEGCGKAAVAQRLAQELGRAAHTLPLDAPEAALDAILAAGPAVIAVPHKLLSAEGLRRRLMESGRVLYLMAGVEAIAQRQEPDAQRQAALRERLGRQRTAFEPLFMQTLHLLAPADGPLDDVVAQALERVRF